MRQDGTEEAAREPDEASGGGADETGGPDDRLEDPEGLLGGGRGWLLAAVGVGWLAALGMRFVVPALLPEIRVDLGVSNTAAGVAITLIWITYGGMQFPAGALIDRLGERLLLAGAALVGGASLLAFASAPGFGVFLLACAAFGLGTGLYGPPRATVLSRTFASRDAAAFGIVLAAGSLGAAALPLLAGVLSVRIGWRLAIGVFAPVFLVAAVGLWRSVPPADDEPARDVSTREVLGRLRGALGQRAVVVAAVAQTLLLFAFQGLTAFFPTYLVAERGMSQALAAAMLAVVFASGALFQLAGGNVADRFGHHRVLLVVAAASVPPLVALPYVHGQAGIAAIAVLFGVRAAVGSVSNSYVVRVLPEAVRGTAWGLVRSLFFVVGATGSAAVGAMADRALFDEAFFFLAGITALGTLLYVWLPPRESVT